MRNHRYSLLALVPLLAAAGLAQAAEYAQGLSVGVRHDAVMQAQNEMRPGSSGAQGAMERADKSTGPATAESRMSEHGKLNTNGPNSLDRDKGTARAEDRSSAQAKTHARNAKKKKTDLD